MLHIFDWSIFHYFLQLIFRLTPLTSAAKSNEKLVNQKLCNCSYLGCPLWHSLHFWSRIQFCSPRVNLSLLGFSIYYVTRLIHYKLVSYTFLYYRLFYYNHFRSLNINSSAAGANAMSLPNSSGTTPEPAFVHPNNLQPPLSG